MGSSILPICFTCAVSKGSSSPAARNIAESVRSSTGFLFFSAGLFIFSIIALLFEMWFYPLFTAKGRSAYAYKIYRLYIL